MLIIWSSSSHETRQRHKLRLNMFLCIVHGRCCGRRRSTSHKWIPSRCSDNNRLGDTRRGPIRWTRNRETFPSRVECPRRSSRWPRDGKLYRVYVVKSPGSKRSQVNSSSGRFSVTGSAYTIQPSRIPFKSWKIFSYPNNNIVLSLLPPVAALSGNRT